MPDTPSPEDPFADLFGKLPDPADRTGAAPRTGAVPTEQAPPAAQSDASAPTSPPPSSRRAARAAAANPAPAAAAAPAAPPARPAPVAPAASVASSVPARAPQSSTSAALAGPAASQVPISSQQTATALRTSPTATLDALFTGEVSTQDVGHAPTRHDRDRRKSRIAGWVIFFVILAILGGLVAGGFYVWNTYEDQIRAVMGWEEPKDYEEGMATGEAVVTIVSGDTGSTISTSLYDAGVTKTPRRSTTI